MNPRNVLPPSNPVQALHTQKRDVTNAQTQLKDEIAMTVALLTSLGYSHQAARITHLLDQTQALLDQLITETLTAIDQINTMP